MNATKNVSIKSLFAAVVRGYTAAGQLRAEFARAIKAKAKDRGDKANIGLVRAEMRKACGLPTSSPSRPKGPDGKQVGKSREENLFDVTFHRATGDVFPKAKAKAEGKATAKAEGKEGPVAKGLSARMSAYALVLQDAATAKTEGKLSKTEATALDKLLGKLKAIAELA